MTVSAAFFQSEISTLVRTFQAYPNVKSELILMSTAVKADLTTLDRTMQTPLGILYTPNSPYQSRIGLLINKGKAGNLPVATMGTAIDAVVATLP